VLTVQELLEIKARMLLAAEAAHQIVSSANPLELDEPTFALVTQALVALRADARAVLAEVDILRGMVTGSFDTLFKEASEHGRSADVAGGGKAEVEVGGAGERPDAAGTGGDVRSGGTDGEAASRPKPKRNRRRRRSDPSGVDTGG
jgi:hypothetical protein